MNFFTARHSLWLTLLIPVFSTTAAQTPRQVNHQFQTWFSINTSARFSSHWSALADLHLRRNHFLSENNFEFLRAGLQYSVDRNLSIAGGMGHMWLHPTQPGWKTVSQENRIYEQLVYQTSFHRCTIQQRFRIEQRWQQKIADDQLTGSRKFSFRYRYLLSLLVPLGPKEEAIRLNLSNELCIQSGHEVVYNPFDQNRLFFGIRQPISHQLSFDTGYMLVWQQKPSGYQFDENNTFRLFFYYSPDWSRRRHS